MVGDRIVPVRPSCHTGRSAVCGLPAADCQLQTANVIKALVDVWRRIGVSAVLGSAVLAGSARVPLAGQTAAGSERANASEPARAERGTGAPASERVGGSAGAKPPGIS